MPQWICDLKKVVAGALTEQCAEYVDNQSKTGQLIVVPPFVPKPNSDEIPLEQREYSYRAISSYSTLKLPVGASLDEIKAAYRKLAIRNHPDKFPLEKREQAEAKFKKIGKAYSFLSDDKGYLNYIRKGEFDPRMYHDDRLAAYEHRKDFAESITFIYMRSYRWILDEIDQATKKLTELSEMIKELKLTKSNDLSKIEFLKTRDTICNQLIIIFHRNAEVKLDVENLNPRRYDMSDEFFMIEKKDTLNDREMRVVRNMISGLEKQIFEATHVARYTPSYSAQTDDNKDPDNTIAVTEPSIPGLKANQL